jgi:hypothetical protein
MDILPLKWILKLYIMYGAVQISGTAKSTLCDCIYAFITMRTKLKAGVTPGGSFAPTSICFCVRMVR